jgi:hypothetical protein
LIGILPIVVRIIPRDNLESLLYTHHRRHHHHRTKLDFIIVVDKNDVGFIAGRTTRVAAQVGFLTEWYRTVS